MIYWVQLAFDCADADDLMIFWGDANRLHIDLASTDVDGHRARLEKLGATVQRWDTDHVMLDPEGNESCLN